MDFKKSLLLLTCVFAAAQVIAHNSSEEDEVDTKSKNKKYDCLTVRNHFVDCGDAVIAGLLTANGGIIVNGNEVINGNETVNGNLIVTGTVFVGGSEVIGRNLNVVGAACVGSIALCPAPAAGTPGVPGIGGDLAYGIVTNETARTVATGGSVVFDTVGTESGETGTTAGITITETGVYRMQFQVRALPSVFADPVVFTLENNASPIANAQFSSGIVTSTTTVNGAALVSISTVPTPITVVNTSADTVTLPADGSVNAYLLIERIAA